MAHENANAAKFSRSIEAFSCFCSCLHVPFEQYKDLAAATANVRLWQFGSKLIDSSTFTQTQSEQQPTNTNCRLLTANCMHACHKWFTLHLIVCMLQPTNCSFLQILLLRASLSGLDTCSAFQPACLPLRRRQLTLRPVFVCAALNALLHLHLH